ncbi:MAG: 2OG-Fe(II) oxygenase family protein [Candidatus Thermoplasmatota archaeon]|jgi:Rps23 Pro-64 3,4-dihydroxylase Tpa1-like proline 4-hydroxylase|nr:2OG-Fe(II) oxygenase family protein [Candidatus Thermoplasmatota archaeon]MEC8997216.1 2OG-Fe(II) oxygenase family protein [Candidatus Thermoplasmatota archaeon]MED6305367.1 2OG-Fe(II) oxygenase family protein [Candidatus Thermoplasmatota archaeon]MEE3242706.1 2OG-Fe(II) oxygenase family protein [Candidatus Thermoplasmatota archaeon]
MRKADKIPRVKLRPFPHVVVKNFLDSPTLDLAIDALAGLEYDFKESDLFSYWASIELTDVNHPAINILRDDLGDQAWRKKVAESFKIKKLSSIDMAAYVYGLGDFLLPHDDQVEGRIIAYSLHLTPEITDETGGALNIFKADKDGKSELVDSLIPEYNSLIMFEVSNRSWHEVNEIVKDIQRLTLTGWYHG